MGTFCFNSSNQFSMTFMGLSPLNQIIIEFTGAVMIDKVGNGDGLFPLAISILIDRDAEAIARPPGVFHIWVLLDGPYNGLATDARTGAFSVPPKELPAISSLLPTANTWISFLIANAHDPSSDGSRTGDEIMCT
jgi:hypothetical protein